MTTIKERLAGYQKLDAERTPGEWDYTTRQNSWDYVVYQKEDSNMEVCQPFHDGDTNIHDSRFIAAAPAIYADLRKAVDLAEKMREALEWYGDKTNYIGADEAESYKAPIEGITGGEVCLTVIDAAGEDSGQRARVALTEAQRVLGDSK